MEKYRIYTVYHQEWQRKVFDRTMDEHRIWYDVNEKKGINYMNKVWSEMVAMYEVWQGGKVAEFIGFNHYRRQFDVRRLPKAGECQIYTTYDFGMTIYEQYAGSHNYEDMNMMLDILDEEYGKGNAYSHHIMEDRRMISNCCFLMEWSDFDKLCKFMFKAVKVYSERTGCGKDLQKWRKKAEKDFKGKDTDYQMRVVSFLVERLISAWITVNMRWYEQKDVVIVHHNTPELTEALVRSLFRHTPDCDVFIFDNSTTRPFTKKMEKVKVIDNTKGRYIDFQKFLSRYPERVDETKNDWASARHCYTVDFLTDIFTNGFVLMDSDILITHDISVFYQRDRAWVGQPFVNRSQKITFVERLLPFLCWINVPMAHAAGIRYFDGRRMWKLRREFPYKYYDTGASFFHDCRDKRLPYRKMILSDYMVHFGSGSFARTDEARDRWLEMFAELWK